MKTPRRRRHEGREEARPDATRRRRQEEEARHPTPGRGHWRTGSSTGSRASRPDTGQGGWLWWRTRRGRRPGNGCSGGPGPKSRPGTGRDGQDRRNGRDGRRPGRRPAPDRGAPARGAAHGEALSQGASPPDRCPPARGTDRRSAPQSRGRPGVRHPGQPCRHTTRSDGAEGEGRGGAGRRRKPTPVPVRVALTPVKLPGRCGSLPCPATAGPVRCGGRPGRPWW